MSTGLYAALFSEAEQRHGLPAGVLESVAVQESGRNPWAIRYEAGFFAHYIAGRTKRDLGGHWPRVVTEDTERRARATSWGLLQVIGQTAREHGFVGQFLSQLCDPETGVAFGAMVLARKMARYGDLADALSAYNAGSPTDRNRSSYVAPILARLA